jgi:hypothetical protein
VSDVCRVLLPLMAPPPPMPAVKSGGEEDSDSDDDAVASDVPPPGDAAAIPAVLPLAAAEPLPADDADAPAALPPAQPHCRPVRGTKNANPRYRGDPVIHYPQVQAARVWQSGEQAADAPSSLRVQRGSVATAQQVPPAKQPLTDVGQVQRPVHTTHGIRCVGQLMLSRRAECCPLSRSTTYPTSCGCDRLQLRDARSRSMRMPCAQRAHCFLPGKVLRRSLPLI